MSWQFLVAVSVVTFSISILLQRILLHNDKSDPVAYVIVFQASVGLIIMAYAFLLGFEMPDFRIFWFPALISSVLFGAAHVAYAKTLQLVEASVFSILAATRTFWIMLFGITLFDDSIDPLQLLGALFIFCSICLVAERRGGFRFDRGIFLGLLTGLLMGLATVGWIYVGNHSDGASWTALSFLATSLIVLASQPRAAKHIPQLLSGKIFQRILLLGVLFSISSVTVLQAFQTGSVSLIAPLHATTIIVTVLLAIAFLHERTRLRWKTAAAVVCFMGVLLIV
jgi:uncharacterized membrane protein